MNHKPGGSRSFPRHTDHTVTEPGLRPSAWHTRPHFGKLYSPDALSSDEAARAGPGEASWELTAGAEPLSRAWATLTGVRQHTAAGSAGNESSWNNWSTPLRPCGTPPYNQQAGCWPLQHLGRKRGQQRRTLFACPRPWNAQAQRGST